MNYLFASLMIGISGLTLALAGLPAGSIEAECHGAPKGSIVAITNCPDMPEKVKAGPAGNSYAMNTVRQ